MKITIIITKTRKRIDIPSITCYNSGSDETASGESYERAEREV